MTPSRDEILSALRGVIDPELGIDVVRLGMVREIEIHGDGKVIVHICLTTASCPFWELFVEQVRIAVESTPGVETVEVAYRHQQWRPDLLDPAARRILEDQGFLPPSATVPVPESG